MEPVTTDETTSICKKYQEWIFIRENASQKGLFGKLTTFKFYQHSAFDMQKLRELARDVRARGYRLIKGRAGNGSLYVTVADFAT